MGASNYYVRFQSRTGPNWKDKFLKVYTVSITNHSISETFSSSSTMEGASLGVFNSHGYAIIYYKEYHLINYGDDVNTWPSTLSTPRIKYVNTCVDF